VSDVVVHEVPASPRIDELPIDASRGTFGMSLAILTEALLFVMMFFAYYYVGHDHEDWPTNAPKLKLALILLAILVTSSFTMVAAERSLRRGGPRAARLWLLVTIALGAAFLVIQVMEYRSHLKELRPTSSAYGSLFYAITSLHGLHVVAGLLMLIFVALLPTLRSARSPYRPLHDAGLYWHFVDIVWVFVVGLLYVLPHWSR
jgi:heme/copper-type cytochrome/quinol oxidase subunit 3